MNKEYISKENKRGDKIKIISKMCVIIHSDTYSHLYFTIYIVNENSYEEMMKA